MNVLVTGGAGYIGSHTCSALLKSGFNVIVIDNLSTGFMDALPSEVTFYQGDIRDTQLMDKIFNEHLITGVIHFAAKLNVNESLKIPLDYYDNNSFGIASFIKICQKHKIKSFVFSSTCATYGNATGRISENTLQNPITPYGWSKLFAEKIIEGSQIPYAFLRYFNVAGAAVDGSNGQRTAMAYHLIHVAALAAAGKLDQIQVYGNDYPTKDGTCVRDYMHVEDLAEIHVLAFKKILEKKQNLILNCGYGQGFSVLDVLQSMQKVSHNNFKIEFTERRPGDPTELVADNSLLKNTLNWFPKKDSIDLICETAFKWEKYYNKK